MKQILQANEYSERRALLGVDFASLSCILEMTRCIKYAKNISSLNTVCHNSKLKFLIMKIGDLIVILPVHSNLNIKIKCFAYFKLNKRLQSMANISFY